MQRTPPPPPRCKHPIPYTNKGYCYLNTLPNHTLSLYIAELYPILIHCRALPYLNTLANYTLSYNIVVGSRQPIKLEHQKLRQPIRIEYYVTGELSATMEVPSGLSARVSSLQPISIHGALQPPPPPNRLICSLFCHSGNFERKSFHFLTVTHAFVFCDSLGKHIWTKIDILVLIY